MEEKINQTKTLESGVNHSQPTAPQGFSLNEVQEEEEWAEIGMWLIKGVDAKEYARKGFPKEYHEELRQLDEKYDKRIEWIRKKIRSYEQKIKELENKRWSEIRELQRKYLREEGFILLG
jgi:pyruvate/2-oxoacid:ferredoxin oxidoreductase beta subunit